MSNNTKRILITMAAGLILAAVMFILGRCTSPQPEESIVIKTDTIFKHSVETLYVDTIIYKYKRITDTLYIPADTALLVEEKTYEDSISTIVIEGVNPELKSIEYRIPRDSIFVNTETTIIKKKKYGAFVGVGAYCGLGMGYNYRNNSFGIQAPEVGIGLVVGFGRTW